MIYHRALLPKLEKHLESKEIIVLTGMRRVGKTTILKYLFDKLDIHNKVFLDMGNPISRSYFEEVDYDNIWENLKEYGIDKSTKAYIFLDEIQEMPEIVKAIKYLYDHYDVKFYLTGSSSYYLKNLFPESLAGRKFLFELFPLNFEEFLTFKEIDKKSYDNLKDIATHKNKINYEHIKKLYKEYLEWGGFPEVVLESNFEMKKLKLIDVFKSYFEQDVKGLAHFSDLSKFRNLMILLMQRVGSKLDMSKLASEIEVSRPTAYSYISFLEATYFIYLVPPYSKNIDREVSGADKVYICDTGIVNTFGKVSAGSILENSVFLNLKKYGKVHYYERRKGGEVDFILNEKQALEVKNKATSQYIHNLRKQTKTLGIHDYFVVSKAFVDDEQVIIAQDI